MTEEMSKDLIKQMRKKIKILTAVVIVLSVLLVLVTIFAFSEFEITIEYDDSRSIVQTSDGSAGDGDITQQSEINGRTDLSTICVALVGCFTVITIGAVIIYASKRKDKQVGARKSECRKGSAESDDDNAE